MVYNAEIKKKLPKRGLQHAFATTSSVFNVAMNQAPISSSFVPKRDSNAPLGPQEIKLKFGIKPYDPQTEQSTS